MKVLRLLLAGIFLFTGCNNLDSGLYPDSPLPPDRSGSSVGSNEFCIYEGEQVFLDSDGTMINCLSIGEGPNQCGRVMLGITYASPSVPDEWVDFYTNSQNNRHTLSGGVRSELLLLRVEITKIETKAWFKLTRKFLL